jgi:hypothetical protein
VGLAGLAPVVIAGEGPRGLVPRRRRWDRGIGVRRLVDVMCDAERLLLGHPDLAVGLGEEVQTIILERMFGVKKSAPREYLHDTCDRVAE